MVGTASLVWSHTNALGQSTGTCWSLLTDSCASTGVIVYQAGASTASMEFLD